VVLQERSEVPEMQNLLMCDQTLLLGLQKMEQLYKMQQLQISDQKKMTDDQK
jgi:hypothetical protein